MNRMSRIAIPRPVPQLPGRGFFSLLIPPPVSQLPPGCGRPRVWLRPQRDSLHQGLNWIFQYVVENVIELNFELNWNPNRI